MTRSFLKLFFLAFIFSLGACTVTVRAPNIEVNSPYVQVQRSVAQQQPLNYIGQQQHRAQAPTPTQSGGVDHATACKQRGGTGGFRVNGNQVQCEPGTGQGHRPQPQPMPPGQRYYPQQGQQQQAAPAGYPCRFLQGQTCH